jgi:ATP-dependent Clp protease ATP-binding subunit ClpB
VFRSLGAVQIKQIVRIQVERLMERLKDRRIELSMTDAAIAEIASIGFDPVYGARPLKRAIQNEVMNPLSKLILRGEVRDGTKVTVDFNQGRFEFRPEPVPAR